MLSSLSSSSLVIVTPLLWFPLTYTDADEAVELTKPIIPVRVERGYEPDGWLGELCRGQHIYDLSDPSNFDNEWKGVVVKLEELNVPFNGQSTGDDSAESATGISKLLHKCI